MASALRTVLKRGYATAAEVKVSEGGKGRGWLGSQLDKYAGTQGGRKERSRSNEKKARTGN
jgi:hypothetical protein